MRFLALLAFVTLMTAADAPMLIPLGVAELTVQPGAAASALLAQERHQQGMAKLRAGQKQEAQLELTVLLRVVGGTVTVNVRPSAAGSAPLASAVIPAGDGVLRLTPPAASDLLLEATTEGGAEVQVTAVVYGDFFQPGIMNALVGEGNVAAEADDAAAEKDPALKPFVIEARNLKQILTAMVVYQGETELGWPVVAVEGVPVPPQTPEQASLLTAAAFEMLARRLQLPPTLFVSPFSPDRILPAPRSEAEIAARPDPAWAADYAYDWAAPGEVASYRVIIASRRFALHPRLGQGVTVACSDSTTRFLPSVKTVEVQGTSTAGLSGFGNDLLPAVPNPDAAGRSDDREGPEQEKPALPDNIFDDHGDGEAGSALMPGRGDHLRAFVK